MNKLLKYLIFLSLLAYASSQCGVITDTAELSDINSNHNTALWATKKSSSSSVCQQPNGNNGYKFFFNSFETVLRSQLLQKCDTSTTEFSFYMRSCSFSNSFRVDWSSSSTFSSIIGFNDIDSSTSGQRYSISISGISSGSQIYIRVRALSGSFEYYVIDDITFYGLRLVSNPGNVVTGVLKGSSGNIPLQVSDLTSSTIVRLYGPAIGTTSVSSVTLRGTSLSLSCGSASNGRVQCTITSSVSTIYACRTDWEIVTSLTHSSASFKGVQFAYTAGQLFAQSWSISYTGGSFMPTAGTSSNIQLSGTGAYYASGIVIRFPSGGSSSVANCVESTGVCNVPPGAGTNVDVALYCSSTNSFGIYQSTTLSYEAPTISSHLGSTTNYVQNRFPATYSSTTCCSPIYITISGSAFSSASVTRSITYIKGSTENQRDCDYLSTSQMRCYNNEGVGTGWSIRINIEDQQVTAGFTMSFPAPVLSSTFSNFISTSGTSSYCFYGQNMGTPSSTGTLTFNSQQRSCTVSSTRVTSFNLDQYVCCNLQEGTGGPYSTSYSVGSQSGSMMSITYSSPFITSPFTLPQLSPSGGSTLTIDGGNFGPAGTSASLNYQQSCSSCSEVSCGSCSCTASSHSRLVCTNMPAGQGADFKARVIVDGRQSSLVTVAQYAQPIITNAQMPVNIATSVAATLTITGSNFGTITTLSTATDINIRLRDIESQYQFPYSSCTPITISSIQCTINIGASGSSWDLAINLSGRESDTFRATIGNYIAPTISSITLPSPFKTVGSQDIIIDGANFGSVHNVVRLFYGPYSSSSCSFNIDHIQVRCVSQAGIGCHQMRLQVSNQNSTLTLNSYCYESPTVSSTSSSTLTTSGSETIIIYGNHFGECSGSCGTLSYGPSANINKYTANCYLSTLTSFLNDAFELQCTSVVGVGPPDGQFFSGTVTIGAQTSSSTSFQFRYQSPSFSSTYIATGISTSGGSVTVQGNNFGTSSDGIVFEYGYGLLSIARTASCTTISGQSAHTHRRCTLDAGAGANWQWSASVGGRASTNIAYTSYAPPQITGVNPSSGFDTLGTRPTLVITGSNFGPTGQSFDVYAELRGSNARFRYDRTGSTGFGCTHISQSRIDCTLADGAGKDIAVYVRSQLQEDNAQNFVISYKPPVVPAGSVAAQSGVATIGGGLITISGEQFGPSSPTVHDTSFGTYVTTNVYMVLEGTVNGEQVTFERTNPIEECNRISAVVGDERVECKMPQGVGRGLTINLRVGSPFYAWEVATDATIDFDPPELYEFSPKTGPINGNIHVRLKGNNFGDVGRIEFLDNNVATNLSWVQNTAESDGYFTWSEPYNINMTLPTTTVAKNVSVNLNIGDQSAIALKEFIYYKIDQVVPAFAPLRGGVVVTMHGENFYNVETNGIKVLLCNTTVTCNTTTASHIIDGVYKNTTRFLFTIPSTPLNPKLGQYNVYATLNGRDYVQANGLFTVYAFPKLNQLIPRSGPLFGNTIFSLYGSFHVTGALTVRLDGQVIRCDHITSTLINCTSPTSTIAKQSLVEVSVDYSDIQYTNDDVKFQHYLQPNITSIDYPLGPIDGNALITIRGSGIVETNDTYGILIDNRRCINGKFSLAYGGSLTCYTPSRTTIGFDFVEIALNNQQYTQNSGIYYQYYEHPILSGDANPSFGPIRGNFVQWISGNNIIPPSNLLVMNDNPLYLRYNYGNNYESIAYAQAIRISNFSVNVTVPAVLSGAGLTRIYVSLNNYSYSPTYQTFEFYDPPVINSIKPKSGPIIGNTDVTITGRLYPTGVLYAKFGQTTMNCTFVSRTTGICKTKNYTDYITTKPESVAVTFTMDTPNLDFIQFSAENILFQYYGPFNVELLPTTQYIGGLSGTLIDLVMINTTNTRELAVKFSNDGTIVPAYTTKYEFDVNVDTQGADLINYPIRITFDTATPIAAGTMRDDCADIRVRVGNYSENLKYYVEPDTCNRKDTGVWVLIDIANVVTRRRLLATYDSTFKVIFGEPVMSTDLSDYNSIFTTFSSMNLEDTKNWLFSPGQKIDVWNGATRIYQIDNVESTIGSMFASSVTPEVGIEVGILHQVPTYDENNLDCSNPTIYFSTNKYDYLSNATLRVDMNCTTMCIKTKSSSNCTSVDRKVPRFSINVGVQQSCVFSPFGIDCWGASSSNQLNIQNNLTWSQVSSGNTHVCGITTDNKIYCWGSESFVPSNIQDQPIKYVSAGSQFTCALFINKSIECWGSINTNDILIAPSSANYETLYTSSSGTTACAVASDNTIECWGTTINLAVQIGISLGLKAVGIGNDHICIIRSVGTIYCEGLSGTSPPTSNGWIVIESGNQFSCAINEDNELSCFGTDTTSNVLSPPINNKWVDVSITDYTACGITLTGAILCWGDNQYNHATPPSWAIDKSLFVYERIAIVMKNNNDTILTSSLVSNTQLSLVHQYEKPLIPYITANHNKNTSFTLYRSFGVRKFSSNEPTYDTSNVIEDSHVWEFLTPSINSTTTTSINLLFSQNSQNFPENIAESISYVVGPKLTSITPLAAATDAAPNITLVGTNLLNSLSILPKIKVGKYNVPSYAIGILLSNVNDVHTMVFQLPTHLFQGSPTNGVGKYPILFSYADTNSFGIVESEPSNLNEFELSNPGFCSFARLTFEEGKDLFSIFQNTLVGTNNTQCTSQGSSWVVSSPGGIIETKTFDTTLGGEFSFRFGCTTPGTLSSPVSVEYSNNNGLTWVEFDNGEINTITSTFVLYTFSLPLSARSKLAKFRIVGYLSSGNFGIDNIDVRGIIQGDSNMIVSSVGPLSGPISGGTQISVTGFNLFGASCTFGGEIANKSAIISEDGTSMKCFSPETLEAGTVLLQICGSASPPESFVYYKQIIPNDINLKYVTDNEWFSIDGENIIETTTNEEKVVFGDVSCTAIDMPNTCLYSSTVNIRNMVDIMGFHPGVIAGRKGFPLGGGDVTVARFKYPAEELSAMGLTTGDQINKIRFYVRKAPTFKIENFVLKIKPLKTETDVRLFTQSSKRCTDCEEGIMNDDLTPEYFQNLVGNWWEITLKNPITFNEPNLFIEISTRLAAADTERVDDVLNDFIVGAGSLGYRQYAPIHDTSVATRSAHNGFVWYGSLTTQAADVALENSYANQDEPFFFSYDISMIPMLQVCTTSKGCLSRTVMDVLVPNTGINTDLLQDTNVYVALNGQDYKRVELSTTSAAITLKGYSKTDDIGTIIDTVNPPGSPLFGQTVFYITKKTGTWENQEQYTVKFTFLNSMTASDPPVESRYPISLNTWSSTTSLTPYSAFVRCKPLTSDFTKLECMTSQISPYPGGVMTLFELSMNGFTFYRPSSTSLRFEYFKSPVLKEVTPPKGTQAGNTLITVSGDDFWNPLGNPKYGSPSLFTGLYGGSSGNVFQNLVVCYFIRSTIDSEGVSYDDLGWGPITNYDAEDEHRTIGTIEYDTNTGESKVICRTTPENPDPDPNAAKVFEREYHITISFNAGLFNPRFNYMGTDVSGYSTDGLAYNFQKCFAGSYSPAYTIECAECELGRYSDSDGLTECSDCEVGYYAATTGRQECTQCLETEPGSTTTADGRDSLASIDPLDRESFERPPTFQDVLKTGSTSPEDCVCQVGYLFNIEKENNNLCAFGGCCDSCYNAAGDAAEFPGAICPGGRELNGSYSQPWARFGYYLAGSRDDGFNFFSCSPPEACHAGPTKYCAEGYEGFFCGQCAKQYYRDGNRCKKCPSVDFVILALMFVLLIIFIKLFALIAPYLRGMGAPRIFFNYVSATASFIFFNLRWPTIVLDFYDFLQYFSLNIDLVRPECQLPIGFRMQFFILQITPLVIAAILFTFYGIECVRHSYMCMDLKIWWVQFRSESGRVRHWWHPLWIFEHFIFRPITFLSRCFTILLLISVLAAIRWVFQKYVNLYDRVVNKIRGWIEKDKSLDSDVVDEKNEEQDPLVRELEAGGEVFDRSNEVGNVASYASFRSQQQRGALFQKATDIEKAKQKKRKRRKKKRLKNKKAEDDSGPLPRFDLHDIYTRMKFADIQHSFSEVQISAKEQQRTMNNSTKRSSVLKNEDLPPEKLNWHDLTSKSWMYHDKVKTRFLQQSMRQEGLRDFEVLRNLQMQIMSKYPTNRDFKKTQDSYATVRLDASSVNSEKHTEALELKKKRNDALNTTLNALCMVLTFSHLILLRRALDMLACFEVASGDSRLVAYPEVKCGSSEHGELVAYAVLALLTWGLGMPFLLLYLLYRKSVIERSLDDHDNKARYGYLFLKYSRAHWYWEFVIMLRKSLLVVIIVFYQADEDRFLQVLLALLLFLASLALQRIYNPFIEENLNSLEFLALSNNVIVLFVGSIFLTERIPFGGSNATGMGWFLIVFISIVVAILFRATWEEVMQAIPGLYDLLTFEWVKMEFKRMTIQLIYGDRYVYDIAPAVAIRTSQYSDKEWARMNTFERNHIELALQRQEQLEQVPILTPVGQWCAIQWLKDVNTPPRDRDTYIEGITRNAAGVFTELFMIADRHLHNKHPRRPAELIALLHEKRGRVLNYMQQADEYVEDAFCVPLIYSPNNSDKLFSVNGYLSFSEWDFNLEQKYFTRNDYIPPDSGGEIEDLYEEFGDWHMCDTPTTLSQCMDTYKDIYVIGCLNGDLVIGLKTSGETFRLQPHYVPDLFAGLDDTNVIKMRPSKEILKPITCIKIVEILNDIFVITTSSDGTLAITEISYNLNESVTIFHSSVAKNQIFTPHTNRITCLAVGGNIIHNASTAGNTTATRADLDDDDDMPSTMANIPGDPNTKDGDNVEPGTAFDDNTLKVVEDDNTNVEEKSNKRRPTLVHQNSTSSKVKQPEGRAAQLPILPLVAVTGAEDGSVMVWNIEALILTHRGLLDPLPLNLLITSVTATGASSRSRVRTPLRHRGEVRGVKIIDSFLPPVAISYGSDGSFRMWDLGTLNVKLRFADVDSREAGMVTNILRFSIKFESAINDCVMVRQGTTFTVVAGCENGRIFKLPLTVTGGPPKPYWISPPAALQKNSRWTPSALNHSDDVDKNRIHQLLLTPDNRYVFVLFDRFIQFWEIDPEKMHCKGTREYGSLEDRPDGKNNMKSESGVMQPVPSGVMQPVPSGIMQPMGPGVAPPLPNDNDDDDDDMNLIKRRIESARHMVLLSAKQRIYTFALATNRGHIQIWQVNKDGNFKHLSPEINPKTDVLRVAPNVVNEDALYDPVLQSKPSNLQIINLMDDDDDGDDIINDDDAEDWMAPPPMEGTELAEAGGEDNLANMLPEMPNQDEMDFELKNGEESVVERPKKPWFEQSYAHPYYLAPNFFTRWTPLFSNLLRIQLSPPERQLLKFQKMRMQGHVGGVAARVREHLLRRNAKFMPNIVLWSELDHFAKNALKRSASLDAARMAIRTIKNLKFLGTADENMIIELVKETPALATVINDYRRNNELDRIEKLLEELIVDSSEETQKTIDIDSEALFIGNVIRRRNKRFEWLILSLVGLPSMARDILASSTVRELATGEDWVVQLHSMQLLGMTAVQHQRRASRMVRQSSNLQERLEPGQEEDEDK